MTIELEKFKKKKLLRNNEYYDFQEIQDKLYKDSKNNKKFTNLMDLIVNEENILLAYRNIKRNKGSKTAGTNTNNIIELAETEPEMLIKYVRNQLINYKPQPVRRVEIPKENCKTRPLGIPCIEDRLIQQCIKQILEPICEAKFHKHNYGFRPNRSTHHAVGRMMYLANKSHLHYVVDIDIKGFFDNVNHGKLLKQMWTMGIQDKRLITIISKMLKTEIKDIGKPTKGTPQGGILSPLLSNIVLNELDWWISNQWETFKTKHNYSVNRRTYVDESNKYKTLRNSSKLKEIYIVRYADDFKLMCRNYETAQKAFIAVKKWLKERLNLDISLEKSKVINIRKNYSNFLGFKLKIKNKGKKKVINSHISDKSNKKIIRSIIDKIKKVSKIPNVENVSKYNSTILGMHNYYKYATHVNKDFSKIAFLVSTSLYNRTKNIRSSTGAKSKAYMKFYGEYNIKAVYIAGIILFPIAGIRTNTILNFSQDICNYTVKGREKIHSKLTNINYDVLRYIIENPILNESVEYNDNRVSLYVGQQGRCNITGEPLQIGNMESHHKKPRKLGGTDKYNNLVFVTSDIHRLIHAVDEEIILKYLNKIKKYIDKKGLAKLNKLRKLIGNCELYM
ncbi:group II intron reverse transcriptase/maturase [Clostridium botulinum]|nr:group II intron reverse transcriptase/maturase [Clostridium botulinum]NFP39334.1 group II intron reverse transcriptase/maturase [Clostridium botulinum]